MSVALVTGITGQDGAYLAQFLLDQGYDVFGSYRAQSAAKLWRLEHLGVKDHPRLHLVQCDLTDFAQTLTLMRTTAPREVYNLAGQSFVNDSFGQPVATGMINGIGAIHVLEAVRAVDPSIRVYQAGSSEMFGHAQHVPQDETTVFCPRNPYGVSKVYSHWATVNYREYYGMFAATGILFNHESPLRGRRFVTRKITDGVARIRLRQLDCLQLGNLDARRDWGFAGDYVRGMHAMLQADEPDTFVLATGRSESVRTFVQLAFGAAGIDVCFERSGIDEYAVDVASGAVVVRVDPLHYRPAERLELVGNAAKAARVLGWRPSVGLEALCEMMVQSDLALRRKLGSAPAGMVASGP